MPAQDCRAGGAVKRQRLDTVQRRHCKHCGTPVDHHVTEYGRPVDLDVDTVPVTTTLTDAWPYLWENHGRHIGWEHMSFPPQRTWRDVRTEHQCGTKNEHKKEKKNE